MIIFLSENALKNRKIKDDFMCALINLKVKLIFSLFLTNL